MISEFLGCLTNRAKYEIPQTGWETMCSATLPGGNWDLCDCSEVIQLAKSKGVTVTADGEWMRMRKGRSEGNFMMNVGGAKAAQQFLEGVR